MPKFWFIFLEVFITARWLIFAMQRLVLICCMGSFQGKFNFPSDVEVSNDAKDLMQRLVY